MNETFSGLPFVKCYLDDILIHSSSLDEHKEHVKSVLKELKEKNLTINIEKSKIAVKEVSYLGYIIDDI